MSAKKILCINGSIRGSSGNSARVLESIEDLLKSLENVTSSRLEVAGPMPGITQVRDLLLEHDAFFVVSGNYWSSWGSALQRFIEVVTQFENSPVFFGKPFACAVTMDSVGGMDIASRLHSTFSGLGCWSPPCSTAIISRVAQEAIAASAGHANDSNEDVWRMEDLDVVISNLVASCAVKKDTWKSWPFRELNSLEGDWPATGLLDLGSDKFL